MEFRDGYIKTVQESLVKVKLKGLKELFFSQTWEAIPNEAGLEQCIFWHQCGNWKCARRFVAARQERKDEKKGGNGQLFEVKEYDFFCYVTTEELTCWQTHKSYGQRATCETWIEESKNQMALGQIKMDVFWGSSAIFQCSILAYNTVRWIALPKGFRYYRRAAELGNLSAMCDLGLMLLNGDVEAMEYLDSWFTCKKA